MTHPITDQQADALLRSRVPAGTPGLAPLADLVATLRASTRGAPQPSAALAARLGQAGSSCPNRRGGNG